MNIVMNSFIYFFKHSVFVWPKIPTEGKELDDFNLWFNNRSEDRLNDILDPYHYTVPDNRFHTVSS